MTANLEERQFFRIKTPCSHAEIMLYLSLFAAAESFAVLFISGAHQRKAAAVRGMYVHHRALQEPPADALVV